MSAQSPSKLSPTAGAFMPGTGAVQTPHTNANGELEFTRSEFMSQNHEISSIRSNYGENYVDNYGGSNYGENYQVENQYDNGQYGIGTNYYPEYNNNGGGSMYGDNGSNNFGPNSKGYGGDFKKPKGYKNKNKNFKNKPQYSNQPASYYTSGEQPAQYYMSGDQHALYYAAGEQSAPYYMGEQTQCCELKRKALAEGMTLICVGCGAFGSKQAHGHKGHNWTAIDNMDYSGYLNTPICPHGSPPKKHYGGDRQMGKK